MRESRVDIVDPVTGEVVDRCTGPTTGGSCPRATPGGPVLCSGHRIVPLGGGPESWQRWVSSSARRCPLAADAPDGDS